MKKAGALECARCGTKECSEGKDCFGVRDELMALYGEERLRKLHTAASAIEARHYCKETRLGEIVHLARELECQKLGLVFCVGLSEEAGAVEEILSKHFKVESVCCKVAGIDKRTFGLEQIEDEGEEMMCNPVGAAHLLNRAGTDFNIICGLCVGHDALFSMASEAPTTTLIAKDRVLAHNPAAAVYCRYVRRNL